MRPNQRRQQPIIFGSIVHGRGVVDFVTPWVIDAHTAHDRICQSVNRNVFAVRDTTHIVLVVIAQATPSGAFVLPAQATIAVRREH